MIHFYVFNELFIDVTHYVEPFGHILETHILKQPSDHGLDKDDINSDATVFKFIKHRSIKNDSIIIRKYLQDSAEDNLR